MKGEDEHFQTTEYSAKSRQALHLRAEKIAREKTAKSSEKLDMISPEEMQQTLHELRVQK